jgi:serine/threonine protein kinase
MFFIFFCLILKIGEVVLKLSDFGTARDLNRPISALSARMIAVAGIFLPGTPLWSAPEIIRSNQKDDFNVRITSTRWEREHSYIQLFFPSSFFFFFFFFSLSSFLFLENLCAETLLLSTHLFICLSMILSTHTHIHIPKYQLPICVNLE